MTPRRKKLIGLVLLPPGLILYFGAVVTAAERLPDVQIVKLLYFIVTGLAWAAPTIPFIRWMEREPQKRG
ncbi:MAG TPA: DUF2842 domain-containing protein [Parvularculaceae bacterium]|nr:DUF2842 domain-containing protein [Parvularculaceae bacterium]